MCLWQCRNTSSRWQSGNLQWCHSHSTSLTATPRVCSRDRGVVNAAQVFNAADEDLCLCVKPIAQRLMNLRGLGDARNCLQRSVAATAQQVRSRRACRHRPHARRCAATNAPPRRPTCALAGPTATPAPPTSADPQARSAGLLTCALLTLQHTCRRPSSALAQQPGGHRWVGRNRRPVSWEETDALLVPLKLCALIACLHAEELHAAPLHAPWIQLGSEAAAPASRASPRASRASR